MLPAPLAPDQVETLVFEQILVQGEAPALWQSERFHHRVTLRLNSKAVPGLGLPAALWSDGGRT